MLILQNSQEPCGGNHGGQFLFSYSLDRKETLRMDDSQIEMLKNSSTDRFFRSQNIR